VAVKPTQPPTKLTLPAIYPCNKGKKSTPEFKTYASNSGVASNLLELAATAQECQKVFLEKVAD
jgi:hypothetical protein